MPDDFRFGWREKAAINARWHWERARDWVLRFVHAQHNARVIIDFERRMTSVIHEATGYLMSKPYYELDTMLDLIREHHSKLFDDGYEEAKLDYEIKDDFGIEGDSVVGD